MLRELSSAYRIVINGGQALVTRIIQYYTKDRPLNTLLVYAAIKIIVLLGAIVVSLLIRPDALLQNPLFLIKWDGVSYQGIAREGYAYGYPFTAAFPPMYPVLIKIFSLNQSALMPLVEVLISNAFSFVGLYFLYKLVPLVVDEKYRLRVCFAYMVFPVLLVCNLVSYSEPIFLGFTIGAYYFWKRAKFGYAALLAIFSVFTRQVGAFILVIFVVDMLYGYFSQRQRSQIMKQLAVIVITCAGVGMLYLFYLYRFGDPFIASRVEAAYWFVTFSVTNIFDNISKLGFGWPGFSPWLRFVSFNYAVVPIFLIDTLLVVATVLALLKRDLALSVYSFVSLATFLSERAWPNSFVRYTAAIFPLYLFLGLMLSDDWNKNIVIGVIGVVIAIQNMFMWINGVWQY